MALRQKPKQNSETTEDRTVDALIGKGGSVATSNVEPRLLRLQLRLSSDLVHRVDNTLKKRIVAPSRHDWFLEAILEKLEREKAID